MKIKSQSHIAIDVAPGTLADGASKCHNLLPMTAAEQYLSVGADRLTLLEGNYRPIHHLDVGDGYTMLLLLSGTDLYSLLIDDPEHLDEGVLTHVATLDAVPHCVTHAAGVVYLMIDDGAFRVDYDEPSGEWIALGVMPQLPGVRIAATNLTPFSATVEVRQLTGSYSHWQGSLTKTDLNNLTADLLDAYSRLKNDAFTSGFFLQPVLARYHLFDDDDNLLYSSSPTMVSAPDGFQCVDKLTLTTADFATLDSYALTATGYRLEVQAEALTDSPWTDVVARVEVEVTPILDPIDTAASAQCRLESIDASMGHVVAYMPGTSVTMVATAAPRVAMIRKALATFVNVATPLATFANPFRGGIAATRLSPPTYTATAVAATAQRFTARCVRNCGDVVAWGNVSMLRPFPPSMAEIATECDASTGYWRGCVSVTFASGEERVVWSGYSEGAAPLSLSPLLCYPGADAVEMTVAVVCGDRCVRQSFPLTPLAGTDYAYYLDASLASVPLTTEVSSYIVPSRYVVPRPMRGSVAVSSLDAPLLLTATRIIAEGDVVALTPAVRSSSSWDFARTHLYAFSTSGIYATSINAARTTVAAQVLDTRRVTDGKAVAYTGGGVYAEASGDLIAIAGSKSAVVRHGVSLSHLAWDSEGGLLWGVDTLQGVMRLYDIEQGKEMTADVASGTELYSAGGLLLTADGSTLSAVNYSSAATRDVQWCRTIHLPDPRQRLASATFFLSASQFDGTISIRAHGGAGDAYSCPVATFTVEGEVNAPISVNLVAPPRPYITIDVAASVASDFYFHHLILTTTKAQ